MELLHNLGLARPGRCMAKLHRGMMSRGSLFVILLTAAGSAYYHLAPGNQRLFGDRLPERLKRQFDEFRKRLG